MSNNLKALEAKYKELGTEIDRLKLKHPKQGDWCKFWDDDPDKYIIAKYFCFTDNTTAWGSLPGARTYAASLPEELQYFRNCKPIEFLEIKEADTSEPDIDGNPRILSYNKNYPDNAPKVLRNHDIMWCNVGKYAVLPDEV